MAASCALHIALLWSPALAPTRRLLRVAHAPSLAPSDRADRVEPLEVTLPPLSPPASVDSRPPLTQVLPGRLPAAPEPDSSGAVPAPLMTRPGYYPPAELSQFPQAKGDIDPESEQTRRIPAAGTLIVKVWINERGDVDDATVIVSDLPAEFALAATAAFKQGHFQPGVRDGLAVKSVIEVEVSYSDNRLPAYW